MVSSGLFSSLLKILLVTIISIALFIVGIPLISMVIKNGYGKEFSAAMFGLLLIFVVLDRCVVFFC